MPGIDSGRWVVEALWTTLGSFLLISPDENDKKCKYHDVSVKSENLFGKVIRRSEVLRLVPKEKYTQHPHSGYSSRLTISNSHSADAGYPLAKGTWYGEEENRFQLYFFAKCLQFDQVFLRRSIKSRAFILTERLFAILDNDDRVNSHLALVLRRLGQPKKHSSLGVCRRDQYLVSIIYPQ